MKFLAKIVDSSMIEEATDKKFMTDAEKTKLAGIGEAFIISGTLENTSWSGTEAPYTKEVTVTGIVGSGKPPVIDVVLSTTWNTAMTEEKQWSNIKRVAYADDKLTFYATAVPSVSLNFKGVQVK